MQELTTNLAQLGQQVLDFINRPAVIVQAVIILLLFGASWALAWWAEPRLQEKVRGMKEYPGLLRLVVVVLRRSTWLLFVALLTVALVLARTLDWPADDRLLSTALLLALAWIVISVVSHVVRSRLVGRLFAVVGWIYVATVILGITDDLAVALDNLALEFGEGRSFSLLQLLHLIAVFSILLWIAVSLGNFLDQRLQRSDELTPSLRILIGKMLRVTLLVVAAVVGLSLTFDVTVFAVFAGALGVGIGFGLQKLVSNFISGIVILLDRSIEPGDTISLGDTFGWVNELRARFVSVVTRDGREYLIPNEDFITQQVINWSFTDELVRLDLTFGVSYDSDPHQVRALAVEAARDVPRVVASKPPVCWLSGFGESSLDFLLRFWIEDPQQGLANIRGSVLLALWDKLKENGIAIPYPHRDIRVTAPVTVQTTRGT